MGGGQLWALVGLGFLSGWRGLIFLPSWHMTWAVLLWGMVEEEVEGPVLLLRGWGGPKC